MKYVITCMTYSMGIQIDDPDVLEVCSSKRAADKVMNLIREKCLSKGWTVSPVEPDYYRRRTSITADTGMVLYKFSSYERMENVKWGYFPYLESDK